MSDNYRKLTEECDRAETALRNQVDRNVTVHLRARQADIYERALRTITERIKFSSWPDLERILLVAERALQRGEKLK